jgi:hypothetical protein
MDILLSMGFAAPSATAALQQSGGNVDIALDILLNGGGMDVAGEWPQDDTTGQIISLSISQYSFAEAGSSACTVIAASMVDFLLAALQSGVNPQSFSAEQLSDIVIEGVTKYSQIPHHGVQHLSVDELDSGFFVSVLPVPGGLLQGLLDEEQAFQRLFQQAQSIGDQAKFTGLILTKPPETICIILPPANDGSHGPYILFDSHSRPQDGLDGSYMFVATGKQSLINRLKHIFPSFGSSVFDGGFMASMYNMFEATVFQSK